MTPNSMTQGQKTSDAMMNRTSNIVLTACRRRGSGSGSVARGSLHRDVGQSGFTLIELLVALGITVLALAGLMSLHVAMMKGNRSAANTAEASTFGQEALEELRGMTMTDITTTYGPLPLLDEPMDTVGGQRGMTYTRTLTVSPITGNLLWMRVVVSWADDGADPALVDEQYKHEVAFEIIRTSLEAP